MKTEHRKEAIMVIRRPNAEPQRRTVCATGKRGREAYDEKATVRNSKSSSFKKLTIWVNYNFVGKGKTDPKKWSLHNSNFKRTKFRD